MDRPSSVLPLPRNDAVEEENRRFAERNSFADEAFSHARSSGPAANGLRLSGAIRGVINGFNSPSPLIKQSSRRPDLSVGRERRLMLSVIGNCRAKGTLQISEKQFIKNENSIDLCPRQADTAID